MDPHADGLFELPLDAGEKARRSPAPRRSAGGKARLALTALIVAVIGAVAANLLLGDDSTDGEEAAAEDGPTEFPAALTARPDGAFEDLTDGQTVRYELDSLPFSAETVTVVCVAEPDGTIDSLLDECDSGTAQRRTTSPGGVLEADLTVHRQIAIGGFRRLDCAARACELRTYAAQAPGVVVGRASLDWTDTPADRLGAQITIEDAAPIAEGGSLTLLGTGFAPETTVIIRPCWLGLDPDPFACQQSFVDVTIRTGPDGAFRFETVVDWEVELVEATTTCAELPEGLCAMTVEVPDTERQPAAVPVDVFRDRLAATVVELPEQFAVSKTEGLVDGELVDITADDWFFTSELELVICAEGPEPLDCTWLALGRPALAGVEVPRSFVTWRGTRHDCVDDGPCVLSVLSFRDPEQRLELPISFDPDAPLREPVPITVTPTDELIDWNVVTVDFEDLTSVPLLAVCAAGQNLTCQGLETTATSGTQIITRVRPALDTPTGPHNCITDGPCELVVWDAATVTRFDTVPLTFADVDQRPLAGIARPSNGIEHGDAVQVAVSDAIDDVSISMCAVDGACVPIIVIPTTAGRATFEFTAVQRFAVQLEDGTVQRTDCAVEACEIRVSDGWANDQIPLGFDDAPPPSPALAVAVDEPLPLDETFTVRGRGFTPTIQPSEIQLLLCPPWAELDSSCVRLGTVSTRRLPADGTFETLVNIPSSAFTTGFQNAMDRCGRECVLVARPLLGEAVELPVIRDTSPS
ncbi:MAG: hypothetical protein AAGA90_01960 [Actinomycetota bacterium]